MASLLRTLSGAEDRLGTHVLFVPLSLSFTLRRCARVDPFGHVPKGAWIPHVSTAISVNVPPQNLEAEESILGALLLSPVAIGVVSEILDPGDFYRESHATIYRTARELWAKGEPVDAITLADLLDEKGELERVGGPGRIAELAALVPSTSNVEHYARIVKEMATLRGLVRVGHEIGRLGMERPGETTDLVDRAEQMVFELAQQRTTNDFSHIEDLLKESFARIMHLYEVGADITGVPSGFRELDRLTSGFQPGNLIILAARPSMGKSALALCMAANLGVRHQIPVGLFTLEMSKAEVTQRMMCSEAKVESQRLRSGKLAQDDWPRLTAACDKLMKAPIWVDDTGSITMMELRSKARRLKTRAPKLGLIIVDYLQLMTSGLNVENRVQEVSQISRSLKVLARDLEVPIIALSQLSRAVEARQDKRPVLSDLRESGCLTGESRVYLAEEGTYRPIRDLVGREGCRVLALDETTWQLEPRRVTNAFSTGTKPVFQLRTRLGRSIRATGNHRFRAFDGWRRLDELAVGDRLALPRRTDSWRAVGRTMTDAELEALATSGVDWDEVVSIEPDGVEEVFDLTVDGLHNFVAEDIVVHNSIEQDADLVGFVYRDEYYNGEESDQQGLAEIILAKHRNGPTDSIKLSFLKRYAKFADLAG